MTKRKQTRHHRMHPVLLFALVFAAVVGVGTLLMTGLHLLAATQQEDRLAGVKQGTIATEQKQLLPDRGQAHEAVLEIETAQHDKSEAPEAETGGPTQVTFAFAGDILLDDGYAPMVSLRQRGGDIRSCFSADLWQEMQEADVFAVNNEFTYTDRGTPTEDKQYTFRARPDHVKYLLDMGVDLATLANNHAYDYGETSLLDTIDTLRNAGIDYIGAGQNLEEAASCISYRVGNKSIAVLSATQIERQDNPNTKGASEHTPGVFRCWNPQNLYSAVAAAKEAHDYVIVCIHWGTENTDELDWAQKEQAAGIAAAGADLIIGNHPHCLQEVGYVDGVPVIYSLGNFWFNSKTVDTCLVKAVFSEEGLQSIQLLPAIQQDCKTALLAGSEKERVLGYLNGISGSGQLDENGFLRTR